MFFHTHLVSVKFMRKEGNDLFNDAFNTFYLWLYGTGHIEKDHSDRKREETWTTLFN